MHEQVDILSKGYFLLCLIVWVCLAVSATVHTLTYLTKLTKSQNTFTGKCGCFYFSFLQTKQTIL